jgi:IclR family transcriptional regulator, KDG regulon repressor
MDENIRAIDRAFDILELLSQNQKSMSLTEIVKASGLSKSTVHRLLQTMYARHYVEKDNEGSYTIGLKLVELISYHINNLELQTEAKPFLADLRSELSLTAHLGILDGTDVIYVEKIDLYPTTMLYSQIGYRSPAYCSSMGKCLLSCLSGEELDETFSDFKFTQYTQRTITSIHALKQHLKVVRMQGWAMDDEEYTPGHRCVGAPIYDYKGDAIASISVSGQISQISDNKLPEIIQQVKDTALQISRRMSYTG